MPKTLRSTGTGATAGGGSGSLALVGALGLIGLANFAVATRGRRVA